MDREHENMDWMTNAAPLYGDIRPFDGYEEIAVSCESIPSDELRSLHDSDEDECESTPTVEVRGTGFFLGKKYESLLRIREEIVEYAVENGYPVKFMKSDARRLTAACDDGCGWRLHASQMQKEQTFQIKSFIDVHSCSRPLTNRNVSAKWVAIHYADSFKSHPTWPLSDVIESVRKDHNVTISMSIARRARSEARRMNEAFGQDQYKLLRRYAHEIMRSNPGSNVGIKAHLVDESGATSQAVFERMYVCLTACKLGLLQYGRPIICLDGCHLKGPCPGQLLTAVSIDGNGGIYPVAVAVVESECKDSWKWFLEQLRDDISAEMGNGWTFLSDRQKGLLNAVGETFPFADQRYCLRHLYANFKERFRGKAYKDAIWRAARASTASRFAVEMTKLASIDQAAHQFLRKIPLSCWATHAFSSVPKCDMGLNNLSESFNAMILPARDKPILTMFEMIRRCMMSLIVKRRQTAYEWTDNLCPKIRRKLANIERASRNWCPRYSGEYMFEVTNGGEQFVVDLAGMTCNCYRWELTGIPCVHVIPCINFLRRSVDEFVHPLYHRDTYLNMYSHYIRPMSGYEMWPEVPEPGEMLPPEIRRKPGRPRKKRMKDPDEAPRTTISKKGATITCGRCQREGHNIRSCPQDASTSAAGASSSSVHPANQSFMGFYNVTQASSSTAGQAVGDRLWPPQEQQTFWPSQEEQTFWPPKDEQTFWQPWP